MPYIIKITITLLVNIVGLVKTINDNVKGPQKNLTLPNIGIFLDIRKNNVFITVNQITKDNKGLVENSNFKLITPEYQLLF